jgi:hypothetical protein
MTSVKASDLNLIARAKFVDAILTIHGSYNYRYVMETFGVAIACATRDMAKLRKELAGIAYNHHTKSFETNADYQPMSELDAVKFLRAVSVVFDSTDYSVPGSVMATSPGGKQ